jgi:hypothetical protein
MVLRPPHQSPQASAFLERDWTLFGPYALDRWRPHGNGPKHKISDLARLGTRQDARNQLEVLAGAISWGFKSPSPHQKNQ